MRMGAASAAPPLTVTAHTEGGRNDRQRTSKSNRRDSQELSRCGSPCGGEAKKVIFRDTLCGSGSLIPVPPTHGGGVPHKSRVLVHSKSMGRTEGANILTPHQDEISYLSSAVVYNSYGPPLMQGPPQKPEKTSMHDHSECALLRATVHQHAHVSWSVEQERSTF